MFGNFGGRHGKRVDLGKKGNVNPIFLVELSTPGVCHKYNQEGRRTSATPDCWVINGFSQLS